MHLLTGREAAALLRLSERTLERWRVAGGGPHFVKLGRLVRYREADLATWITTHVASSTSALGERVPVAAMERKLEETGR